MTEPNRYHVSHISDLFKVPADRQEACLKDLSAWMDFNRELQNDIKIPKGVLVEFTWVDDGEEGLSAFTIERRKRRFD